TRRSRRIEVHGGVMDDSGVVGSEFPGLDVTCPGNGDRKNEGPKYILTARGKTVRLWHRDDQIRHSNLPPVRRGWRRRQRVAVAFHSAVSKPTNDRVDLFITQTSGPDELEVAGLGFPFRLVAGPDDGFTGI